MNLEKTLGSLLGFDENTRVELVQVGQANETPTLELRLKRDAGELGWLTHRRIRLAPGQISTLRDALNLMDPDARDTQRLARPVGDDSNVVELASLCHSS